MDIRRKTLLKRDGINRKVAVGALLIGAVFGFVFNAGIGAPAGSVQGAYQELAEVFSAVSVDRNWILIGKEFSASEQTVAVRASLVPQAEGVVSASDLTYEIAGTGKTGTLNREEDGIFTARVSVADLAPGKHEITVKAERNGIEFISDPAEFHVSHPLYVTWTLDWEGYDVKEEYLEAVDAIANRHGTPIAHFFNPRIYTSPAISASRADYLTRWVIERRDRRGDEIALHLHMFPDMVRAAGVEPRLTPNWGSSLKDGYDILTSAYTYGETLKMLEWSKEIFAAKDLGTPVSFRAGGWFADEETLRAVQDAGFALDSSGRTAYRFGTNGVTGPWDLPADAQPYRLNISDQNSAQGPTLDIWEFPNSGADSWAYTEEQMYARFTANFNGDPLAEKRVVTYLSHPEWFHVDQPKIEGLYTRIDRFLNSRDAGPVVYITLDQAYRIWSSE